MQYLTPHPSFSKELILSHRERTLQHAIKHQWDSRKLKKAIEAYRYAKLQLFRAKIMALGPVASPDSPKSRRIEKIKSNFKEWATMQPEEIVRRLSSNHAQ